MHLNGVGHVAQNRRLVVVADVLIKHNGGGGVRQFFNEAPSRIISRAVDVLLVGEGHSAGKIVVGKLGALHSINGLLAHALCHDNKVIKVGRAGDRGSRCCRCCGGRDWGARMVVAAVNRQLVAGVAHGAPLDAVKIRNAGSYNAFSQRSAVVAIVFGVCWVATI